MTESEAIFLTVVAEARRDPSEDMARLVYADKIQDEGNEELAAVIRVSVLCVCRCVLVETPLTDCRTCGNTNWVRHCQHKQCRIEGRPCRHEPGIFDNGDGWRDGPITYYCFGHAKEIGFCVKCGMYRGSGPAANNWGNQLFGLCDECNTDRVLGEVMGDP